MTKATDRPWHLSMILVISGWISALMLLAALALVLKQFGLLKEGLGIAVVGAIALPIFLMKEKSVNRLFFKEAMTPMTIGAALAITFGVLALTDVYLATPVAWAVLVLCTMTSRNAFVHFTLVITAWLFSFSALGEELSPLSREIFLAAALIAASILTVFPTKYLMGKSYMLPTLLSLGFVLAFDVFDFHITQSAFIIKGATAAILLFGLWTLNEKHVGLKSLLLAALILLALAALPNPMTVALVILGLGWAKGDRSFAIIGSLLCAAFLFQYYTSLELSLLQRSAMLGVIGLALLGIYEVQRR
ncbi:MAG: DUF4401 domain-containing protein [Sphingomonadales bacterium]|jgi:hypothetical protein